MNQNHTAKKATPEQIRAYRNRLLTVILGNIAILLVGFSLMFLLMNLFHRNPAVAISLGCGTVVLSWIGGLTFTFLYFRCPVCGGPIPNVGKSLGHSCPNCNLDFSTKIRA